MIPFNRIKYIVVHATASDRDKTKYEQVDYWHKVNGWKSERSNKHIGYHFFINGVGLLYEGRKKYKDGYETGSHALGINSESIAICLSLAKGQVISKGQRSNLKTLLKKLLKELNLKPKDIIGHRDVAVIKKDRSLATECPTDSLYNELQIIKKELEKEGY